MNQIEHYLRVSESLRDLAKKKPLPKLIPGAEFERVISNIAEKIEDFRPALMIYGIYNSGKSTLLNALLGAPKAKVADRPETDHVEGYTYRGFTIYDTPGVNAPIEHEEVTMAHYAKCELIMFVMSNDVGVEDIEVYRRIGEILKAKKPLVIVLNRKFAQGMSDTVQALFDEQKKRVQENIARLNIPDAEQYYNLIPVDAKSALKGRLENKQALIEYSGIKALEDRINDLLRSDHTENIVRVLNSQITDFVLKISKALDSRLENEQLRSLDELLSNLIARQRSAQLELKSIAQRVLDPLAGEIISGARSGNQDFNSMCSGYMQRLQSEVEAKISQITQELGENLAEYSLDALNKLGIKLDTGTGSSITNSGTQNNPLIDDAIGKLSNPAVAAAIAPVAEAATKTALEFVKQVLPSLMKGKGAAWIASVAGTVGAIAGPVLAIGSALYSAWSDSANADREFEREKERLLNLGNQARSTVSNLLGQITPELDRICTEIFSPSINELRASLEDKHKDHDSINKLKAEAMAILEDLP